MTTATPLQGTVQILQGTVQNLCPHSFHSHVVDLAQKAGVLAGGSQPEIVVKVQNTHFPCAGPICAVYNKKLARCGHIAASAEEIAAAMVAAMKEANKP